MLVSSVQRPGEKVTVNSYSSDAEHISELKKKIEEFSKKDGLTAVLFRNPYNLEKISDALGSDAPQLISEHDALPKSGAFLIELALAKGLEFDNVILADADSEAYPDSELGRHCLYTAMSRATQHLSIMAKGELSANIKDSH